MLCFFFARGGGANLGSFGFSLIFYPKHSNLAHSDGMPSLYHLRYHHCPQSSGKLFSVVVAVRGRRRSHVSSLPHVRPAEPDLDEQGAAERRPHEERRKPRQDHHRWPGPVHSDHHASQVEQLFLLLHILHQRSDCH